MRRLAIIGMLLVTAAGWAGPHFLRVSREMLLRGVLAKVEEAVGHHGEFSVDVLDLPESLMVPVGGVSIRLSGAPIRRWRGTFMRELEILVDSEVVHRQSVTLVVRSFANALVAGKQLDRHALVTAGEVLEQRIETTVLREDPLTEIGAVANMRLKRIVTPGTVLTWTLFEPCPVVGPGNEVELIVNAGAVRLSMKGIAREEGWPGSVINVQPVGRRDRIRATVLDARRAVVGAD